ncbi:cell envelope integrity protein TolA [Enterobacter hormaechei]|nr:cell envelope integrity protein TolA [Enterobacter hormaechei]ELP0658809.1 cell envelope integrity protein TolA [Enterobacter hormaechei]ELT4992912.1 cell envelope integrity protein TolA [Enterobacter hormaechei]ELW9420715.1 cell envelope integrity protein TolA [Enterobacter hormaechei]
MPPERHQAEFSKTQNYGEQIQQAITEQLFEADHYQGKQCTVRISLLRDGMVMNATAEKGDPELCQAALSAVTRAKIPPAPDEKTWQTFKNVPLNFAL